MTTTGNDSHDSQNSPLEQGDVLMATIMIFHVYCMTLTYPTAENRYPQVHTYMLA